MPTKLTNTCPCKSRYFVSGRTTQMKYNKPKCPGCGRTKSKTKSKSKSKSPKRKTTMTPGKLANIRTYERMWKKFLKSKPLLITKRLV